MLPSDGAAWLPLAVEKPEFGDIGKKITDMFSGMMPKEEEPEPTPAAEEPAPEEPAPEAAEE